MSDSEPKVEVLLGPSNDDEGLLRRKRKKRRISAHDVRLRIEAHKAFLKDLSLTVEDLHKKPPFDTVSAGTLRRWAREDRWEEDRQVFIEDWMALVKQRLGSRLGISLEEELSGLDAVLKKADEHLTDPNVLPKSWEGVAKVRVELGKRRQELIEKIGESFFPEQRPEDAAPRMSDAEKQIIADKLLEQRRVEMRSSLGIESQPAQIPATVVLPATPAIETPVEPMVTSVASTQEPPSESEPETAGIQPPRIEVATPD